MPCRLLIGALLPVGMQVTCGDAAVAARVDSEAATIQAWADRNPGKRGEVRLSFYERRQQQGWFVRQEQRLYWEQWRVALTVLPSDTALLELHTLEADTGKEWGTQCCMC